MMNKLAAKKIVTIQARMGSDRLPGKILLPLSGKPSLERMVERVRRSKYIDDVVVATTTNPKDDVVEKWAVSAGISLYRGSESDVLSRVVEAGRKFRAEILVQLTGDCPLMDPLVIDRLFEVYLANDYDYVANVLDRSYPRGFDTQIYSLDVLERAHAKTADVAHREHVSLYIYEHPQEFKLHNVMAPAEATAPEFRVCVDTPEDYEVVRTIFESLYAKNVHFTAADVAGFLKSRPDVAQMNQTVAQKKVRG